MDLQKQEALDLLRKYGSKYYKFLPLELRKDKEILMLALQEKWEPFIFADRSLKNDKSVILNAVSKSEKALIYVPKKLKKDAKFVKYLLANNVNCIKYVLGARLDFGTAMLVASGNEPNLKFLDESYRKNRKIVETAVKSNWTNIYYAYYFNKKIVMEALKHSWNILSVVPDKFKRSKKVMQLAINQNKWAIKYFPLELKDKKIIKTLLENPFFNAKVMQFLPLEYAYNENLIKKVIVYKGSDVLRYAFKEIKTKQSLVLFALEHWKYTYDYQNTKAFFDEIIAQYYMQNKKVLLAFLKNCDDKFREEVYYNLSVNLKEDVDICKLVPYSVLLSSMKSNINVVESKLRKNPGVYDLLPLELKNNKEIVEQTMKSCYHNITNYQFHLSKMPTIAKESKTFCLYAIQLYHDNISGISPKLADDKEFMFNAIKINPDNFYMASKRLFADAELRKLAEKLGCKIWNES